MKGFYTSSPNLQDICAGCGGKLPLLRGQLDEDERQKVKAKG